MSRWRHVRGTVTGNGPPRTHASGGFAHWKNVVIHSFRCEEGHSFRETENRLEYMTALLEALDLEEGDVLYRFKYLKTARKRRALNPESPR